MTNYDVNIQIEEDLTFWELIELLLSKKYEFKAYHAPNSIIIKPNHG